MKRNKFNLIFVSIVLFFTIFLSGCGEGTSSTGSNVKTANFGLDSSFVDGNGGLTFEFQKNSPPEIIRDQSLEPFFVRFYIENLGEYNIPQNGSHIAISGFNKVDLNLDDHSQELKELRGVKLQGSTGEIPGGSQLITFANLRYMREVMGTNFPLTIYADICYPYETNSVVVACMNGDTTIAIDEQNKICELDNDAIENFANSAGPVKIENVKQYRNGEHSINLVFDIYHIPLSDTAELYGTNSFNNDCALKDQQSQYTNKNKVEYVVNTGLSGSINCDVTGNPSNSINLYPDNNGDDSSKHKYTASCEIDTTGLGEFLTPIKITLKYAYRERKSKTVGIQHVRLAGN